ncbi:MAG: hypothetical protein JWQ25_502 [Daejeonella sp.]|nr:hypothetical protein [Daejeonella sp.]
MKRKLFLIVLSSGIFLGLSTKASAQGNSNNAPGRQNPPGNSGNAPGHTKNTDAPFDGGLLVMAGAGFIYTIKKSYDAKRKAAKTLNQ